MIVLMTIIQDDSFSTLQNSMADYFVSKIASNSTIVSTKSRANKLLVDHLTTGV